MKLSSHAWVRRGLALAAVGAATATSADATTLVNFSTPQLTVQSDAVVEGRVVDVEARFRDDHQFVYTYVTIEVDGTHKGQLTTDRIVLEELGGTANGVTAVVDGVPEFEVGERVLVFLEAREDDLYKTYGWVQGKFRLETDPATGREIATRSELTDAAFNYSPSGRLDVTVDAASGKRFHDVLVATIDEWADRLTVPEGE